MVFIEFTDAPGSLSWTSCFHLAGFHGGRLPTHKEVKNLLHSKGFKPLFDTDIWIPVIDRPNCWVSVGNYDPATRLGRTHEKSCGAMPHWGETSAYHAFRTKLGIVHGRVTFVQTNGCLGYEAAMAHAAALGARLATKAEIRGVIEMHHNNPVFNYDVWVPVADKPHTWVSVGNYDPHVRLGRSHTRLFGIPDWTGDNGHYPFRSQLAVVPLISFVGSNGTRGWYAAADYAASLQCRLPYHDEVKRQIELLGNHPLFVSDVWIPVGDAPDTWVSVGNFDPETRLAKTHTFLFGIPPWSNDPTYYSFRTKIGLIPLSYNNIHTPTPIPTPSASDSGECTDATYDLAKLKL